MNQAERQEFADEIKKAFAKVKKPPKNAVSRDLDELQDIVGKNWDEVTPNELSYNLPIFFTAKGLHYYLQAYLIALVLDPEKMDLPMNIIYRLSPSLQEDMLHPMADFDCKQTKVIVAFFELYRELYPVAESLINSRMYLEEEKALEQGWEYWSTKLAECS